MTGFRVGVDIGGTFTDIVLINEAGRLLTRKVSSSVDDYARAIVEGLAQVFDEAGVEPAGILEVMHGTTVASNAILELQGCAGRPHRHRRLPRHPGDPEPPDAEAL